MKNWTVMVYLAGDNNLTGEMAETLEQLKSLTDEKPNISLYVYFDGIARSIPTLYCDFSDRGGPIKYFRSIGIKNKLIKRKVAESYVFNENSASMNNILNFVNWCVDKDRNHITEHGKTVDVRPSKKYALIFSGHSFGFLDWGLLKDESSNYYMTLRKLRWLFERITFDKERLVADATAEQEKEAGKARKRGKSIRSWSKSKLEERTTEILGKPLDLLGFDSCEMSSLEIAYQFHGVAKSLVASEGTIPNSGWNYADVFLRTLEGNADADDKRVAVTFVEEFIRRQNRLALADGSTDMAAWDLEVFPVLLEPFENLATGLMNCFADSGTVTYRQMRRLLTYVHWQCQTYSYEQKIDLGDFCQLMVDEIDALESEIDTRSFASIGKVRDACKAVLMARRKCVLLSGYSGSDFQYSKGISVFFPWSLSSYESAEYDYKRLTFIGKTSAGLAWNAFLEKYLAEISMRPANKITPIAWNGALEIPNGDDSVVFESYTFLDERGAGQAPAVVPTPDMSRRPPDTGKRPPDTGKRPPDTGKRPPDTGKRPPDTGKLGSSNMSVFLSRFMRLKNFEPSWNRTGYTSARVHFESGEGPVVRRPEDHIVSVLKIPAPTGIQKVLDLLTYRMTTLGKDGDPSYQQLLDLLKRISIETPDSVKAEVFNKLQQSPLLRDEEWIEAHEGIDVLTEAISSSISGISDKSFRLELGKEISALKGGR